MCLTETRQKFYQQNKKNDRSHLVVMFMKIGNLDTIVRRREKICINQLLLKKEMAAGEHP